MQVSNSDLTSLAVFRSVVEHRSFLGAQVALGLSQSAVSFHIKGLEQRLGFRLCRRGRSGFELTDRGAIVYDQSKLLFLGLGAFESAVGGLRDRLVGTLRLGLVDNTVTDLDMPIYRVIAAVSRKAPEVIVKIEIKPPELLISELGNGGIDAAIVPETQTYPGLRFSPLREEPQSLYCGASHPLFRAAPSKIDAKTVAQYPFAIRPYAKGFELQHVPGAIAKTAVSSMEAQAMLVLSGLYLSYLPEHYAKAWVKTAEMRSLSPGIPGIFSKFFLATRAEKRSSSILDLFIQELISLGSERSHRSKGLLPKPARRQPRKDSGLLR
jgi:LysR family transcriptional regulator, transcriptional activator for bauABCD operon